MKLRHFLKNFSSRLFVLSLDGVPYTFLEKMFALGKLPYMEKLFKLGGFKRMNSTLPPVSSVAWATYMTGKNPAAHNIFGFVDRTFNPLRLFFPNGTYMRSQALWERLSKEGKKVIIINVPVTFPPKPVNGILISCFLSPNIEKAVYPVYLVPRLKELGYQIDIDAQRAREDRRFLIEDLNRSTQKRFGVATLFMEEEEWDFFHLHIMGTDRINHFLWRRWEDNDPYFAPAFEEYYQSVDLFIGNTLVPLLDSKKNISLMILSDHGFCRLQKEAFLNTWLRAQGWLRLKSKKGKGHSIEDIASKTRAYSLIPGRIYLNLKGREPEGCIDAGEEYRYTLEELKSSLSGFKDPETGEAVIKKIFLRDDIYKGPYLFQAPDMVVLPRKGFDMKGNLDQPLFFQESLLEGMHTYDDAFIFIKDYELVREGFSIIDVTPTVFTLLGSLPPPDLEGRSLIQ